MATYGLNLDNDGTPNACIVNLQGVPRGEKNNPLTNTTMMVPKTDPTVGDKGKDPTPLPLLTYIMGNQIQKQEEVGTNNGNNKYKKKYGVNDGGEGGGSPQKMMWTTLWTLKIM